MNAKFKAGAMKLHLEDMTSLLTSHGLQGVDTRGDRDDNNDNKLQMDTSDNIDGKSNSFIYSKFFSFLYN